MVAQPVLTAHTFFQPSVSGLSFVIEHPVHYADNLRLPMSTGLNHGPVAFVQHPHTVIDERGSITGISLGFVDAASPVLLENSASSVASSFSATPTLGAQRACMPKPVTNCFCAVSVRFD